MLYKHFTGKHAIFAAVLEEGAEQVLGIFDDLAVVDGPFGEELDTFIAAVMSNDGYVEIMQMRKLAITMVDDPEVHATLDRIQQRQMERTEHIVQRAITDGVMRPDVDAEYVSWAWQGLMLAACYREALVPGGFADMLPHVQRFIDSLRP